MQSVGVELSGGGYFAQELFEFARTRQRKKPQKRLVKQLPALEDGREIDPDALIVFGAFEHAPFDLVEQAIVPALGVVLAQVKPFSDFGPTQPFEEEAVDGLIFDAAGLFDGF